MPVLRSRDLDNLWVLKHPLFEEPRFGQFVGPQKMFFLRSRDLDNLWVLKHAFLRRQDLDSLWALQFKFEGGFAHVSWPRKVDGRLWWNLCKAPAWTWELVRAPDKLTCSKRNPLLCGLWIRGLQTMCLVDFGSWLREFFMIRPPTKMDYGLGLGPKKDFN